MSLRGMLLFVCILLPATEPATPALTPNAPALTFDEMLTSAGTAPDITIPFAPASCGEPLNGELKALRILFPPVGGLVP